MTLARMYDHVALASTPNLTRDANLKEPVSGPFLDLHARRSSAA